MVEFVFRTHTTPPQQSAFFFCVGDLGAFHGGGKSQSPPPRTQITGGSSSVAKRDRTLRLLLLEKGSRLFVPLGKKERNVYIFIVVFSFARSTICPTIIYLFFYGMALFSSFEMFLGF